jgi:hypothetical protein
MSRLLIRSIAGVAVAFALVAGTVIASSAPPAGHDHGAAELAAARGSAARSEFHDAMRVLWEDHITWTRLAIVSLATGPEALPDTDATVARLLRNQDDIGDAIKPFYGEAAGGQLSALLRQHILGAADLIAAAKTGDSHAIAVASDAWYANGNEIADFLAAANPRQWDQAEMRAMMREHLDLTLAEAVARLEGRHTDEVGIYDQVHVQILHMADMLSDGITAQFPGQFRG